MSNENQQRVTVFQDGNYRVWSESDAYYARSEPDWKAEFSVFELVNKALLTPALPVFTAEDFKDIIVSFTFGENKASAAKIANAKLRRLAEVGAQGVPTEHEFDRRVSLAYDWWESAGNHQAPLGRYLAAEGFTLQPAPPLAPPSREEYLSKGKPIFTKDEHLAASRLWYQNVKGKETHWWKDVVGAFYEGIAQRRLNADVAHGDQKEHPNPNKMLYDVLVELGFAKHTKQAKELISGGRVFLRSDEPNDIDTSLTNLEYIVQTPNIHRIRVKGRHRDLVADGEPASRKRVAVQLFLCRPFESDAAWQIDLQPSLAQMERRTVTVYLPEVP